MSTKSKLRRSFLKYLVGFIFVLVGLGVFSYSTVSTMWNEYIASKLVHKYTHIVNEIKEEDYTAEIEKAKAYNESIEVNTGLVSGKQFETDETYENALNLMGDGMMGYIEIPDIAQSLPIYHYTTEEQLASGVGHLHGSSLPIGGEGNSVLTGHTGLPSNMLFTRLDELTEGDMFYIHVLGMDMAYKVIERYVVLPREVEGISIEEGKDLVSLITCTPYGVNSHRLILVGERTEYPAEEEEVITKAEITVKKVTSRWKLYVSIVLLLIFIPLIVRSYESEKNRIRFADSNRVVDDSNTVDERLLDEAQKLE